MYSYGLANGNSTDKYKILHIGYKQHCWQYRLTITTAYIERDLSIIIDNKLTLHEHCSSAVAELLSIIRRSFEHTNANITIPNSGLFSNFYNFCDICENFPRKMFLHIN